jgi:hypothetical protein
VISPLGQTVVHEIAERCKADERVVMRAFLLTGLAHQQDLMKLIDQLQNTNVIEMPYILEAQVIPEAEAG